MLEDLERQLDVKTQREVRFQSLPYAVICSSTYAVDILKSICCEYAQVGYVRIHMLRICSSRICSNPYAANMLKSKYI